MPSVCQSVGLSVGMHVYFGRMTETIKMPFGMMGQVGPNNSPKRKGQFGVDMGSSVVRNDKFVA